MSAHAVPVEKYHGTGNDFLVVDADAHTVGDRAAFARAHCDRETGVTADAAVGDDVVPASATGRRGADGVLFLSIAERFDPTRVVMTLVQPDGSTASMCGNGARVVARWAHDRTGDREFMIDTQAGTRRASVTDDASAATIEMGVPTFDPARVPVARGDDRAGEPLIDEPVAGLSVTAVNTGVPHAVALVDGGRDDPEGIDTYDLDAVAPPVRHADVFPEGANVNLAAVVDDGTGGDGSGDVSDEGTAVIDQRTFERGVEGETQSCGTGAVAVVAAARRLGLIAGESAVTRPPGGDLSITVPDAGHATLTGPVAHEFSGTLPVDPR
ncbi:diaminopimelate epimerase [Halorubrum laminariae]|uniref:diaminopimelate epimerase n=1 Tax=Halorubrum laminariae TaxID=1433523 RepID=UPI0021112BF7|nr:diaminopimelate epimerase [Halorubrum laminariae]